MTMQGALAPMMDPAASSGLELPAAFGTDALGATLIEHFTVVAEAVGGVRRLRELAIELAVRGLLLGKTDQASWEPVVLADVVTDLQNGISKRRGEAGDAVPVLRLADIDGGVRIRNEDLREIVLTRDEQEKYRVENGDILVIRVNGSADLVGRFVPCLTSRNWAYSDHLIRVRLNTARINPAFLCTLARSAAARAHLVAKTVTTAGQRTINQGGLGTLAFVLPPLAEQKRIVAKVDQLMALCDELEARQTKKRETSSRLTKSALQALTTAESPEDFDRAWRRVVNNFDVLVEGSEHVGHVRAAVLDLVLLGRLSARAGASGLPEGWTWQTVASVCTMVTDGEHLTPQRVSSGVALVTAKNVRDGHMDFTTTDFVAPETADRCWRRCKPQVGDLLMVCVGATTGRMCVLRDPDEFVLVRSVAVLRPDPQVMLGDFLAAVLRSPTGQRQIWANVKEQAQPCLYLNRMKLLRVPCPPPSEQRRILGSLERLLKICDELEDRLTKCEERASRLVEAVVHEVLA